MVYVVKPRDTLSKIAKEQLGDASRWPEIAKLNRLANPDLIHPGDKLQLPSKDQNEGLFSRLKRLWNG